MACDPTIDFGPTSPGWGEPRVTRSGGLHPFRTGTLLTQPQDLDRGYPTNGGDFVRLDPTAMSRAAGPLTACIIGDPPALPGYAPCGCYVGPWWGVTPPPRCPVHAESAAPFAPMMPTTTTTTLRLTPTAPALSDADVERIARRVVELMREEKP